MNTRETLQALLDDKKIRQDYHNPGVFFHLVGAEIQNHRGEVIRLFGTPSPYTYDAEWHEYVAPNPHPKGTFAWAREENKRGRKVRSNVEDCDVYAPGALSESTALVYIEELDSTRWTVVE